MSFDYSALARGAGNGPQTSSFSVDVQTFTVDTTGVAQFLMAP